MYKALYAFTGQEGEMNLVKGEQVEVKEKDDNGEFLSVSSGAGLTRHRLVDGGQKWPRGMGTVKLVSPSSFNLNETLGFMC